MSSARGVVLLLALLIGAAGGPPTRADQTEARLGPLFERLKAAPDAAAAKPIEIEIWRIWGEVADPDSRTLLARGTAAMNAGDARTARAAFDLLVAREPGFAEGWNKRATLLYLVGDDPGSVADIRRVLALEPRHFGALSGLGLIHARQDRPEDALRSFEAALAIHPFLPGARASVESLRERLRGEPT
jgi:tetratricopeptide (TPR) repeat protein